MIALVTEVAITSNTQCVIFIRRSNATTQ